MQNFSTLVGSYYVLSYSYVVEVMPAASDTPQFSVSLLFPNLSFFLNLTDPHLGVSLFSLHPGIQTYTTTLAAPPESSMLLLFDLLPCSDCLVLLLNVSIGTCFCVLRWLVTLARQASCVK